MKKICTYFVWLGCFLLSILGLTSCERKTADVEDAIMVYYLSKNEMKVEARPYEVKATKIEDQIEELLQCLSVNSEKMEYKAPLSMGFSVLKMEYQDSRVLLDVDEAYRDLPTTTEILIRAALVRTLTQLEDVTYVEITIKGEPLYDCVGELVGLMNKEQFIDNDGNEINTYELTRVKLYFANETGDKLICTSREKHYSTNTPLERFVIDELLMGPSGQMDGIYPCINPETKVINVTTKDGICYVNLDSSFLTVVGNVSTEVSVYAIVNSLAELKHISKVQILINGEVNETIGTAMFERNLDYVTTLDSETK